MVTILDAWGCVDLHTSFCSERLTPFFLGERSGLLIILMANYSLKLHKKHSTKATPTLNQMISLGITCNLVLPPTHEDVNFLFS